MIKKKKTKLAQMKYFKGDGTIVKSGEGNITEYKIVQKNCPCPITITPFHVNIFIEQQISSQRMIHGDDPLLLLRVEEIDDFIQVLIEIRKEFLGEN